MKCWDCKRDFEDDEVIWTFVGKKKKNISFGQHVKTKTPKSLEGNIWRCRDCHLKAKAKGGKR